MINKHPLVSIVIPVYNAERFLPETFLSIKNQTYTNWEAIFVDDCSTDDSVAVIKKYQSEDTRIKLYQNKSNSRAAITRNRGIDESSGRYLTYLDADDFWVTEKLEKQVKFMQEKKCEFSFTGYEFANEKGEPNGKIVRVPNTINYKQAVKNTTIWTTTVMFDMNLLTKEQIYMPNEWSEDTASWWRILKIIDHAYGLNEVLAYYRRSSGTYSANKIIALQKVWNLYRKVEKLNIFTSAYNFTWYVYRAIARRV
jgi:teichuronic acid biosynthesis glycosyltransferase TuaG